MALYDAFGREVKPKSKPDPKQISAVSVRDRYSTYPSSGLTPQRLAAIFKEADAGVVNRQAELFEEMEEKDPHLFSILQTRKMAVTGLDYEIVPFSEDKKDRDVADFVSEIITGLPNFEDNLQDLVDAIGKGFSALEILWDISDNRNVVRSMERVPQKRFMWINSTTPRLLTDAEAVKGIDLPPFKFVFHEHKTKSGHPTRQGVLRVVAWMYLFKNYAVKDFAAFAEVFGMPLRLGKYAPGATQDEKDALINAVRSLGSDAAGIISSSTEIEFVQAMSKVGSKPIHAELAAFCNAEMSKAVLGQTLTTEQGANGARALGQVHNEVRKDLQKSDCEMLSKTIRRDIIRPLVGFNFGWDVPLPWFRLDYEDPGDQKTDAEVVKILSEAGFKGIGEDHIHETFRIPKPKDGEKTLGGAPAGKETVLPAKNMPVPLVNKINQQGVEAFTPDQQAIEELLKAATAKGADGIRANEEKILKVVTNAKSYDDAIGRLLELYPAMDMDKVAEALEGAMFNAEAFGRYAELNRL